MITAIKNIVIAVPDMAAAIEDYTVLLGLRPVDGFSGDLAGRTCFDLFNTRLELVHRPELDRARLSGLVFADDSGAGVELPINNTLQLDLRRQGSESDGQAEPGSEQVKPSSLSIDHVVLRTRDADACVALFAGSLGIRLALDKTVPEWGGRMLFFRTGGITLEVIEAKGQESAADYFWGIALQCNNIEHTAKALIARGVSLSEVRDGRKPGTRVSSVKSHTLRIPMLLIEPASVS
jgi:catechol 2,3-dioxygenase-like lactoylglutathione lyase family enzyme